MSRPTFGVVLCVYNQAEWLEGALAALVNQSPGAARIIVVDDGSTDGSGAVADRFKAGGIVEVVRLASNIGVIEAGRVGLAQLDTDYVGWFSADDRVLPGIFDAMGRLAERHPGVGILASDTDIEAHGNPVRNRRHSVDGSTKDGHATPERLRALNCGIYTWFASSGAFLRRDALLELGGWRSEFDTYCDWFAVYAIALRHGASWAGRPYSLLRERSDSIGSVAARDPTRRRRATNAMLDALRTPALADVRAGLREAPLILTYGLGERILGRLLARPADWDLLLAILPIWAVHRLKHRLKARQVS